MPGIIVSDTSCLILLNKINNIDILGLLFGQLTITSIIAEEFDSELPEFIKIKNPKNKNYQRILESFLDPGEASAIALAVEQDNCLLIMDDQKGRKQARALGINITGTLGILIVAKEKGILKSVSEVLSKIRETDFRISDKLIKDTLKRSGESS
ncbi:MAG: DUF3368 domain-containing protein [bacterium]